MVSAVACEGLTRPATPSFAQSHSSESRHEIQLGWPHVSKRRRESLKLAVHDPVVVRERDLRGDVILLETEMVWGHRERVDGLARRETL